MFKAIEKNLEKGIYLLNNITDEVYSDQSIPPFFSSIGCHFRHILDMFSCIINGFEVGKIDLTTRERNECAEQECEVGILYANNIIQKIKVFSELNLKSEISITDNLGLGKQTAKTTLGAALMQAQSHAIHHYASIGFIIHQLGVEFPDAEFGYNPTTPNKNLRAS